MRRIWTVREIETLVLWGAVLLTIAVAAGQYTNAVVHHRVLAPLSLTLLSALVATWGAVGIWAGRNRYRPHLLSCAVALGGISFVVAVALIVDVFTGGPGAGLGANTSEFIILLISVSLNVAGARLGYPDATPVDGIDREVDPVGAMNPVALPKYYFTIPTAGIALDLDEVPPVPEVVTNGEIVSNGEADSPNH